MNRFTLFWSTLPSPHKWAFGVLLLVAALLVGGVSNRITAYLDSKEKAALIQSNKEWQTAHDIAVGEARAKEQTARELKMQADALKSAVDQGNAKVKELGKDYEEAVKNYEIKKNNPDGCIDGDCERQLCRELHAAGLKVECAE